MFPLKHLHNLPSAWRKRLMWVGIAFVLYSVMGFLVLPAILKWQLLKQIPAATKRKVTIQSVRVNPWTLSLTLKGFEMAEAGGGERFLSWDQFHVNFQASSLFRLAWTFKEVRLEGPYGHLVLLKGGRLNISDMFPAVTNAAPVGSEQQVPAVNIFHLQVTNGFMALEDRTRKSVFKVEYRPINLNLHGFTTKPHSDTPYAFHAESDAGRSITWAGDLSIQPLKSAGSLELTGIMLRRYQPYFEDFTTAVVTNGTVDLHLSYRFAYDTNGPDLVVSNGSFTISGLEVLDPTLTEKVIGFRHLILAGVGMDLRAQQAGIQTAKLEDPVLVARVNGDGKLNLLQMLVQPEPAAETNMPSAKPLEPWTARLGSFVMTNASLTFEDLTRKSGFKTVLSPINLSLASFTTEAGSNATYEVSVATESAEKLGGKGTLSINPILSAGEVSVEDVTLPKYMPYAEDAFRGELTRGKVAVRVPYSVLLETNSLRAAVSNMVLTLTGLEVKGPEGDEPMLTLRKLALEQVEADLETMTGRAGKLSSEGAMLRVRREKEGGINLLTLLPPQRNGTPEARAQSAPAEAKAELPFSARIDEVDVRDYTVKVEDLQPATPAQLILDQIALNVKGLSSDLKSEITPRLSLRLNEGGTVSLDGRARLDPLTAELNLSVTNIDLRAGQPYLSEMARLELVTGLMATSGRVQFNGDGQTKPMATFAGDFRLDDLKVVDSAGSNEFFSLQSLAVSGIDVHVEPHRAKLGEIKFVGPLAHVSLDAQGQPNLTAVMKTGHTNAVGLAPEKSASAEPAVSASRGVPVPMEIGAVVVENAGLRFWDASIQPKAELEVMGVRANIRGLNSAPGSLADVDITGKVGEQSQFSVTGRLNPLAPEKYMDLTIVNTNLQLTPLTPYMEKYAGYPLLRGRLSTQLRYQLEGTQLEAQNQVKIQQLTLGPRNSSPDATAAPVKLGVALLKDANGEINLDVPVSGRLDDPEFRIAPIVMQVVMNMIVKAAASPFKLIGGLVGGGEELSFVEFPAGSDEISETEAAKLAKLAKGLAERPALSVEIEGQIDPARDRTELGRQELREHLTKQAASEKRGDEATLTPELYAELVRDAFAEQFGTNVMAVLREHRAIEEAAAQTNRVVARVPFTKRVLGVVGLGGPRLTAAEKRLSKGERAALAQASPEVMETVLAGKVEVDVQRLQERMKLRAERVRDWLMKNGAVDGERLLLVPPRAIGPDYRGEAKVVLTLN